MIRAVELIEAFFALNRCHRIIAGDDRTVRQLHNQRRIIFTTIGIDQQAREAAHDGWCVKLCSELTCQFPDTDIIRDMPFKLALSQTQTAIFNRQVTSCMVGSQKQAKTEIAIDLMDGEKDGSYDMQEASSVRFLSQIASSFSSVMRKSGLQRSFSKER